MRMNATTVQNVVTYDTIVDFDNPDLKLFPGMTAYISIPVASVSDVVKIPNAALRYKPELPRGRAAGALSEEQYCAFSTSQPSRSAESRPEQPGGGPAERPSLPQFDWQTAAQRSRRSSGGSSPDKSLQPVQISRRADGPYLHGIDGRRPEAGRRAGDRRNDR